MFSHRFNRAVLLAGATAGIASLALTASLPREAAAQSGITVRWQDAVTGRTVAGWTTGERIRVTVTGSSGDYYFSLREQTGAAGDRGREIGTGQPPQWTATFQSDSTRFRPYGVVSYSVLQVNRRNGQAYPIATLWRQ